MKDRNQPTVRKKIASLIGMEKARQKQKHFENLADT